MESLPGFSGWGTPGVHAGDNLVDPGPEGDEDGGAVGEFDNIKNESLADAAVEDNIVGQLFGLDNLHSHPIPYDL